MPKQRPRARAAARKPARPGSRAARPAPARPKPEQPAAPPVPARPPRRESYDQAVRLYESGLEALQRREFGPAAAWFRQLLERYPDERELHERTRLYLRICERESEPPPPPPQTLEERVYAATLALNAGAPDRALALLGPVSDHADRDDVHYMLAVAHSQRRDVETALAHLRRAIELNPDNRLLARQEPDFDPIRSDESFKQIIEPVPTRRRPRSRPGR